MEVYRKEDFPQRRKAAKENAKKISRKGAKPQSEDTRRRGVRLCVFLCGFASLREKPFFIRL
jgi:hypothetical protein